MISSDRSGRSPSPTSSFCSSLLLFLIVVHCALLPPSGRPTHFFFSSTLACTVSLAFTVTGSSSLPRVRVPGDERVGAGQRHRMLNVPSFFVTA